MQAHDTSDQVLVGPEKRTTIREHLKDEYGYANLDEAAAARDFDVLDRARDLLVHRCYDDPIIIRQNEDGYDVITHG